MVDHAHGGHGHAAGGHGGDHLPAAPTLDFDKQELAHFDKEDVTAGSAIGRMLALIFLYTIFAMSIAAWWTFKKVSAGPAPAAKSAANH